MAPSKAKKPNASTASKPPPPPPEEPPKTQGEKLNRTYAASRPHQHFSEKVGWSKLTDKQKLDYTIEWMLENDLHLQWDPADQTELLKHCAANKISKPEPKPRALGVDRSGRKFEDYSVEEYSEYRRKKAEIWKLKDQSLQFRRKQRRLASTGRSISQQRLLSDGVSSLNISSEAPADETKEENSLRQRCLEERNRPFTEADFENERKRRLQIASMEGSKKPGLYETDPKWDDVTPLPQDDGEKPLAAIAYTDEYAEAISYLRAIMLNQEYSTRALSLTAHIIDMNPAHYTVWLYRASILKALNLSITEELEWVNEVALSNQKNYQIWHHRQMMIDLLFPTLDGDRAAVIKLAKQETAFMNEMFSLDSKNYHVWSYRQYLVRKLSLFTTQTSSDPEPQVNELSEIERMLKDDVRNNSAWAHRFYIVFSDPGHSTPEARALEQDPLVPASIIDREVEFAQTQTRLAPQNQSPWNYLRGVLRKGGRELASVEEFAREFALFSGDGKNQTEKVTSSHALDLLADVWAEKGEKEKADKALELLGEKYDRIRKKFWEYRRQALKEGVVA